MLRQIQNGEMAALTKQAAEQGVEREEMAERLDKERQAADAASTYTTDLAAQCERASEQEVQAAAEHQRLQEALKVVAGAV